MKKIVLFSIFSSFTTLLFSQGVFKKNDIFFELGGNGLFTSLNFERQITKRHGPGIRLGAGFYSIISPSLTIPFGVNYLFKLKDNKSFIDLGIGMTWTKADVKLYVIVDRKDPNYINTNYINVIPSIGYRRQTNKNLMWRISWAPVINHNGFIPFVGLSIGKLF